MTDDEKRAKLARMREKMAKDPKRMHAMLAGMFATMDAEHDFEDPALDDFLVALIARQDEPCDADDLATFIVMCKCSVVPTLRRLAVADRIRLVDGRFLPNPEDMQ